jgi:uroporphyrinogen decarboxylase
MTRRERVLRSITHQESDIVPYNIFFTQQSYDRIVEHTGDPNYEDKIGNHYAMCAYDNPQIEIKPGYFRDYFGVVWNKTGADKDIGVIDNLLLPDPTLGNYKFPDVEKARIQSGYQPVLDSAGDKCVIGNLGFSMFERAWTMRGMENLLMDMIAEPDFVDELLDAICEHNLKILDLALQYPIDIFHFGDDWGQQKGLIMGPNYWRRFIKPRVARMYEKVRNAGKFVSQHSCGDIQEIFPDLIDIGLNQYQTFQPEIYNIHEVKRDFGKDLTFWGGISTQRLLPFASPDEVKKTTREIMKVMGEGGGYVAAPTHDVPADVPPENIIALVEVFQNQ